MVFFRNVSCGFIVFRQGFVFIAEIHLSDLLHVLGEILEALFDLTGLGPDPSIHQLIVVVCQMHEPRKALPQPYRINQRETHSPNG